MKQFLFLITYVNSTRAGKCRAEDFGCVFIYQTAPDNRFTSSSQSSLRVFSPGNLGVVNWEVSPSRPSVLFPLVEKLPCATGRAAPAQPPASASHERAQSPLLQPGDLAALCHHPTVLKCTSRCPWHRAACHLCHHRTGVSLSPRLGGDAPTVLGHARPLPAMLYLLEDSGDLIIKRANYIDRLIKTLLVSEKKNKKGFITRLEVRLGSSGCVQGQILGVIQ